MGGERSDDRRDAAGGTEAPATFQTKDAAVEGAAEGVDGADDHGECEFGRWKRSGFLEPEARPAASSGPQRGGQKHLRGGNLLKASAGQDCFDPFPTAEKPSG